MEIDPSFAAARLALGKLHVRAERWADAAAQLERAVALDPGLAEAHYQLGRVYARLKRTSEAQAELATFKRLSETQLQEERSRQKDIARRLAAVRF